MLSILHISGFVFVHCVVFFSSSSPSHDKMSSLRKRVSELRDEYGVALEAIHHQQLVIQRLESMLALKVPPQNLVTDVGTNTEQVAAGSSQSTFAVLLDLRLRLSRVREKRRVSSETFRKHITELDDGLKEIKAVIGDAVPSGEAADLLLDKSRVAAAVVPQHVQQQLPQREPPVTASVGAVPRSPPTPLLQQVQPNDADEIPPTADVEEIDTT